MEERVAIALLEGRAGRSEAADSRISESDILHTKLWENPCWLSFRINYLALHYNNPIYGLIGADHDLLRPEFVVLYSLFLRDRTTLSEVVAGSGFPKNTLSRATKKLTRLKLVQREDDSDDLRRVVLCLTDTGRAIVEAKMTPMLERERLMLETLSPAERMMLSELLTKLVIASREWPETIASDLPERDEEFEQD
ncbi:MarR family transcriptional regulator [Pseudochrobactrum algeriensis]|uniref:MarR family winged helix-turn-helix transcriptional regulator n=1 Tax=Pseudochrobactrum algeriensis TaxID=2834768 RepID=UPI001BCA7756|nr:winged helix DNA-binding protein [Pseudochrobactrum algeriensis]MBX8782678.1 MarR family transcriptional regulator [Ochrobactrum sp. GRS2]MBX8812182.1 MarR family transcriptional regulator [Ochrobactrum sp. MR34]QVQ37300.1 MarR family transcriptional regulator [Pseudochrobactrum algeriensis]QVQ40519.1 MarR family transcriptional regulator [Pseudochrobactrum algeriensis]QVQ44442.1 MarR family transcriptional regulator [Pseudochrobactrum algeriensis]